MNLWSTDSIIDVFKNLVAGLAAQWLPKGCRWGTPSRSSVSGARQRVGPRVMTRLFEKLARPLATPQTRGYGLTNFDNFRRRVLLNWHFWLVIYPI